MTHSVSIVLAYSPIIVIASFMAIQIPPVRFDRWTLGPIRNFCLFNIDTTFCTGHHVEGSSLTVKLILEKWREGERAGKNRRQERGKGRREGEGFKTCTLGIKISFQPAEARSLWSLPTGPAKNNYCQIESIVNCPQGELPWLERASKREF